jgi:transposase InsO family protein
LQVNRAWYYAKECATDWTSSQKEAVAIRDAIEKITLDFPGYGYRRVTAALQRAGWIVNHKRVLRVMREESLLCHLKRAFVRTTSSDHGHLVYPNLIRDGVIEAPDQVWVADLTYIRLPCEFVYLAAILDAFSRRWIGWHLSRQMSTQLAQTALEQALATRSVTEHLIHHSDRGVQYANTAYTERLKQQGIQISMARKGNPYDNAKAESVFKTLKREEVYLKQYRTFHEAQTNLASFLEDIYNQKRLHSSLGYLPPSECEATWREQQQI